jgi:hypothetical protein
MGHGRLTSCDTDDGQGREKKLLGEHRGWNYAITVTSSIVSSVQLDAWMLGCEVIEATMINLDGKEGRIDRGMLMRVTRAAWLSLDSLLGDRCTFFDERMCR